MSGIKVKRSADGIVMTVHKDVLSAFINTGWEVYVEEDAKTAETPKIDAQEPVKVEAEEVPTEAKPATKRGRKKAVRG